MIKGGCPALDGEGPALTKGLRSLLGPATELLCVLEQFTFSLALNFLVCKMSVGLISRDPNSSF